MNETERVSALNRNLARIYLNAADPKLGSRTWQEVMNHIVAKKPTRRAGAGRLRSKTRSSIASAS